MAPTREGALEKKYLVRLRDAERETPRQVVSKLPGFSRKARRARILLQADAEGPAWTDQRIAEAFGCRTKTVENVRQRLVLEGFATALHGQRPATPSRQPPPVGFANWSLRLLAEKVVELSIVASVSHETVPGGLHG